jgi:anaerobic selenocysteine-containing dehydrogenase
MTNVRYTSCRICAGQCGLQLELDDAGNVTAVRGDTENPVTLGYACAKGITLPEAHRSPDRLLHPLKRQPDGSFARIGFAQALDEIAAQMRDIIATSGVESIAGFRGTMSYSNLVANHLLPEWLRCLGSPSFYSTMTVDQSAKWVTFERLGGWAAGRDPLDSAEVLLWVGTNPLVSLSTFNFDLQHPVQRLRDAKARGLKIVVIDPRRTETARHADVFLQPLPGEDVTVIAGLLNRIFAHGWQDRDFCAHHAAGLELLGSAVSSFTPEYVCARAGLQIDDLEAAAALFAQPLPDRPKRGSAASGTGPNMGPHSNLAEHLLECLNVVCGRYAKPGDRIPNPGVLGPQWSRKAQVIAPQRRWESGPRSRVGGFGMLFGEKMSGALADEILTPGPGQVRALFVDGGNPVIALPQQRKTERAFRTLELLVVIDPFMTATARLAHYVLPPRMMLERHDIGSRDYEAVTMQRPYMQYAEPVLEPPADAQVVDDWEVLYGLAQRLGITLTLDGVALDMQRAPTTEQLLAILMRNASVPFAEMRAATRGRVFPVTPQYVDPPDLANVAKFELAPADVVTELAGVRADPTAGSSDTNGTFRLAVRRLRDVQNTMFHQLDSIRRRLPQNFAYLNPEDMAALGLAEGDEIELTSEHGTISLPARADASVRSRVVSVSHGWGDLLAESETASRRPATRDSSRGVNTNLLTSAELNCDPINAMPCLTGLPLRVRGRQRPIC